MKRAIVVLAMAVLMAFSACTSETDYGECVGIGEEKNPSLKYKASVNNLVLAVIFVETIIVPVYIAVEEVECPVGYKTLPPK